MDIGANIIGGARKAVLDDNKTFEVERIPRGFLMGKIGAGPKITNIAQKGIQTNILLRTAYNETLLFAVKANGVLVCVSQQN